MTAAAPPGEQQLATALTHQWRALTGLRSEAQLKALVADLKAVVWRYHARRYLRRLLPLLLVAALCCALLCSETVLDSVFIYMRLFFVNFVFPVVNLPKLARTTCLLSNPTFNPGPRLSSPEECQHCLGLTRPLVVPVENFTAAAFHRDFLESETPVIVRGGSAGSLLENMTVDHLHEYYVRDELLRETLACSMASDLRIARNNNKLLLRTVLDEKPARWFALWEHCSLPQIKAFRALFGRPGFLPRSISIGGEDMRSWLVLGRDPAGPDPVPLLFKGAFFFLGQLRGQLLVRLLPNQMCTACRPMDFRLAAGDMLLTSEVYELAVLPSGSAFSLSFGFAGEA